MSQFFTNESVSLEKEINSEIEPQTNPEFINDVYEIGRCVAWIQCNNFQKVCLQFPDHLLPDSSEVAQRLQKILNQTLYILADTAYESCCLDYVAAAHVDADAVIHFGPVCFSKTSANIPNLNIYEKCSLDVECFKRCLNKILPSDMQTITILLDTPYIHLKDKIQSALQSNAVKVIDSEDLSITNDVVVFVGGRNRDRKLPNLKFSYKPHKLFYYKEEGPSLINYDQDEKVLRRRYFLIEKIKDSHTFGIVIGTLAVKNYLQAIQRVKQLIVMCNKKYYVISVGKPTVAKLANFPEVDVYVIITCALNEIYDSREYYKPIVTVCDVEMALNPTSDSLGFSYDYNDFISRPIGEVEEDSCDVSLLSGKVRASSNVESGGELLVKDGGTVALNTHHGAGFLAARSWKGLERRWGDTEVKMAEEGRRGIAQHYANETNEIDL